MLCHLVKPKFVQSEVPDFKTDIHKVEDIQTEETRIVKEMTAWPVKPPADIEPSEEEAQGGFKDSS